MATKGIENLPLSTTLLLTRVGLGVFQRCAISSSLGARAPF